MVGYNARRQISSRGFYQVMGLYKKLKMKMPWKQKRLRLEREAQTAAAQKAIDIINERTPESGRAVFIDCGFNTRAVFDHYYSQLGGRYEYIGFEIQPSLWQAAQESSDYSSPPVDFIHAAVSDKADTLYYYEPRKWGLNYKGGASILSEKQDRTMDKVTIPIEAVDFSSFLSERFSEDDFLVVKMDIEGAEYPVLEKLIDSDRLKYIDLLFVEFHAKWLSSTPEKDWDEIHQKVVAELKNQSIEYYDWI